jgi:hypothetical protein
MFLVRGRWAVAALLACALASCGAPDSGEGPGTVHAHLNGQAGFVVGGTAR